MIDKLSKLVIETLRNNYLKINREFKIMQIHSYLNELYHSRIFPKGFTHKHVHDSRQTIYAMKIFG